MNLAPFKIGQAVNYIGMGWRKSNTVYLVKNCWYQSARESITGNSQWWVSVDSEPCKCCGKSAERYGDTRAEYYEATENTV